MCFFTKLNNIIEKYDLVFQELWCKSVKRSDKSILCFNMSLILLVLLIYHCKVWISSVKSFS